MSRGDFKRELKACDMLERAGLEALKDKNQFKRYVVSEKRGSDTVTEERLFEKYDLKAMADMVKTVQAIGELRRSALGQDTEGIEGRGLVVLPEVAEETE